MANQLKDLQIRPVIKSIGFIIVFIGILSVFSQLKNLIPAQFERFFYGGIGTIAALLTTWIFLRAEKNSFANIGLRWERGTAKRFGIGFITGLILSALMVTSLVFFTGLRFELSGNYDLLQFLLWTLALIPLAFMEEVAFRAYPFTRLREATGIRITQVIIAILFALYHVLGGQSFIGALTGPGIWSFVFGLAVIMSGGISLATGLHYAANLVLAAVGQKTGFGSIWTIGYEHEMTTAMQKHIAFLGNAIQVILFIVTVVVMEIYIRKNSSAVPGQSSHS